MKNSKLYELVVKFVEDSFNKEGVVHKHTPVHLKLTAKWVKQLKPDADDSFLIAAITHDIDRAYVERSIFNADEYKNPVYLEDHQRKCAEITAKFLEENEADKEMINKVIHLISKHEEGGDEAQNILKDADSLSFFEGEGYRGIAIKYPELDLRGKIDWMFNRITSEKAKEIAAPMYKRAIKELA